MRLKEMGELAAKKAKAMTWGALEGALALMFAGEFAVAKIRNLPTRMAIDSGYKARLKVSDPSSCSRLLQQYCKEARRIDMEGRPWEGWRPKMPNRDDTLSSKASSALFFALALAGEDEARVGAVASEIGKSQRGLRELDMIRLMIAEALEKHQNYDLALISNIKNAEEEVAGCYLGKGNDAALAMADRIGVELGSAWMESWARQWSNSAAGPGRSALAQLAGSMCHTLLATPVRRGEERLASMVERLGPTAQFALSQAAASLSSEQTLGRMSASLSAKVQANDLEKSLRLSVPGTGPGKSRL